MMRKSSVLLLGFVLILTGCRHTTTEENVPETPEQASSNRLTGEDATPEATAFLARFDQLFNEELAAQDEEYKNNVRRLLLIHARDLLRHASLEETEYDKIEVQRSTEGSQIDWAFGLVGDYGDLRDIFYSPISVIDGKVAKIHLVFLHNSCGFYGCCADVSPPRYITDPGGRIVDEITRILDVLPFSKHIDIRPCRLNDERFDPEFRDGNFHVKQGEVFSEVSFDFLRKVHAHFLSRNNTVR